VSPAGVRAEGGFLRRRQKRYPEAVATIDQALALALEDRGGGR